MIETIQADLLSALDFAVFEPTGQGNFRLIGPVPEWLGLVYPETLQEHENLRPGDRLPFLAGFLPEAEAFWEDPRQERLRSGPWLESDPTGREHPLEASAVVVKGERLLLIELLGREYERWRKLLQQAREGALLRHKLERALEKEKLYLEEIKEINQRLNHELTEAAGYVEALFPDPIREGPVGADWRYIPSAGLGGDAFGYHFVDPEHFCFYLIDVCGHGVGAALLSVTVINHIRAQTLPGVDFRRPGLVLAGLNQAFPMESHNERYFTIWYGVYNLTRRKLTYSSAGHPPALLVKPAGPDRTRPRQLRTRNTVVGGIRNLVYEEETLNITGPAGIIVFSDGAYEFETEKGGLWGFEALVDFVFDRMGTDRLDLDILVDQIRDLSGSEKLEEDLTILGLELGA